MSLEADPLGTCVFLLAISTGPQAKGWESVDSTSEVVGDGKRSFHAHVVFSASETFMITGPSDESASGEYGKESSHLAFLARMHRMVEEVCD